MEEIMQIKSSPTADKFEKLPAVSDRTGASKSTIYAAIAAGTFPKPVKVGRASRWRLSEIIKWMDDQR